MMQRLKQLFTGWFCRRFPRKRSRPEDIPQKLGAQALEKALEEAQFLHRQHAVKVKQLAADELPDLPQKAED